MTDVNIIESEIKNRNNTVNVKNRSVDENDSRLQGIVICVQIFKLIFLHSE